MVNHLRSFISKLSEIVTPFRELLKKDILWHWSTSQKLAFKQIKCILYDLPILSNFGLNEP